jgi:translation elongation factor EF-1beta
MALELKTYGDLKKVINRVSSLKKGDKIISQGKEVLIDQLLGLIPGASNAKTAFDFFKSTFSKPDTIKTNTWLDRLDIDDNVSKIVDDTIENSFLENLVNSLKSVPDDKPLESDFNINKNLQDYLESKFEKRTISLPTLNKEGYIYNKNIDMSNKIKNTVKKNLNTLLETKGFEDMEVAFGVKEKSDNLSVAEKKQFGSMESIQDKESGVINLGDAPVQPALNKVHKEDLKDAEEYYKMVLDRMRNFQKTSESEPSQIGESIESPKVNRKDDQLEDEDVYDIEALGPGMLALKYDNEGTPVHKKFEERMEEMNGDDLTYKKLRAYSEKYLKHKYEKPEEYHQTPKVRVTSESKVDENYSDVIKENIFKVKGEIKSKEQVLKLVDKLPNRVKIDESEFAITDGENYYKLIWEGSTEDGEAVIMREKNTKLVNESIDKMKDLWSFKSSDKMTTKKNIKEGNEDVFFKMMNKVRGK